MQGQMMNSPLLITEIMRFARRQYGNTEVVSITGDNPLHRCTFRDVIRRAHQVANVLHELGLSDGDRVATLAWNDYRHLELYYGVSCAGYVLHTVNPRLFVDQLVYIFNHAGDRVLFVDPVFLPLVEGFSDRLPNIENYVVLSSADKMPQTSLASAKCYETLLDEASEDYEWPALAENTASALCYTSGTTGHPKGVLYDHRSTVLHAYGSCQRNTMALGRCDTVLPVVPMFHANAWGAPYSAFIAGAKMVLPGPKMGDGKTLQALIESEDVTVALGVPTIWLTLLSYLRETGTTIDSLERTIVGGAACPLAIMKEFQDKHGVYTHHAWGMTEMSPLGSLNTLSKVSENFKDSELDVVRIKQGQAPFGVEMKIVDDAGQELPWDGKAFGDLKVRGWWVCDSYFHVEGTSDTHDADGWFSTGDVATIDLAGNLSITDRTKDVIKSGGEWISSIELENLAVAHRDVSEAAVIGVRHEQWGERPLLIVVLNEGAIPEKMSILGLFKGQVADWWIPDDLVVVDEIPHTATGKVSKVTLREQFVDYHLDETQKR
ncbi:MAG: long-chain-fatty-acid--CoA ligase [Gammaproteobacteria bacterium]